MTGHRPRRWAVLWAGLLSCTAGDGGGAPASASAPAPAPGESSPPSGRHSPPPATATAEATPQPTTRVAVFNTALSRDAPGALAAALVGGADPAARRVAAVVRRVDPDVILLLEVDRDPTVTTALASEYLSGYPHHYAPPTNTGVSTGLDLDRDGRIDGPADRLGFGRFVGHFGMLLLSRHPLGDAPRCWGQLRWDRVPGRVLPDDRDTAAPEDFYDAQARAVLPVSSKNHCAVEVMTPSGSLWLLIAHPTPPVFDGPEDRNGLRNAAEIRMWVDWLDGAPYMGAPLPADARFVIAGDLNADPFDGEADHRAIRALLEHPRVAATPVPTSAGAGEAARRTAGINASHRGPHGHDTAAFDAKHGPGNLRVDYVLPSRTLTVTASGVHWPLPGEPGADAVAVSDHRLVWVDVALGSPTR